MVNANLGGKKMIHFCCHTILEETKKYKELGILLF